MPRKPRDFKKGYCYHITARCNSREFRLSKKTLRQTLLYTIDKARGKYSFRLYALCIMSNHVHYLIEPDQPHELSKIMHYINWYTAMCFNRLLNRTGHFWEQRDSSTGFPNHDKRRALNTLRYIHANPKAAGMKRGFFYDFSNYGTYHRLNADGITDWHPAFLTLGDTLDECARRYRNFCWKYRPRTKPKKTCHWGNRFIEILRKSIRTKVSPAQLRLYFDRCQVTNLLLPPEIAVVAEKFTLANGY